MAFTLTTATTEVRAILNEASAYFWSDTEIQNWIKQGCLDFCEKSLSLIKADTITLATSTYKYTTSGSSYIDDAIHALNVEHNNKALRRITLDQMRGHNQIELATDSYPKYYYDTYDGLTYTFYVGPTPSSTYNGESLTVLFACRTDDITEIPYEYQQTIFLYAASKAHAKDRQFGDAQLMWQMYINNISFARMDRESLDQQATTDKFRIQ
jgi:hypothetical protein